VTDVIAEAARRLRRARRIHVTGNVAAGKSSVARALAEVTGLPLVHMDTMIWLPGWQRRPDAERQALLDAAVAGRAWVIDGVSAQVRERCDAMVFIDLPTMVAVRSAVRRMLRLRMRSRPELGDGYPELRAWRPALRLALRFNRYVRPGIVADLDRIPVVVRIVSPGDVDALVRALAPTPPS
jgi:hypothetical protein